MSFPNRLSCRLIRSLWILFVLSFLSNLAAEGATQVETIVCIRHAEKPAQGLGQLSPEGQKRALALPQVLQQKFGTPQYIFAPDPAKGVDDHGVYYSYVRPLATIEPTAIGLGLPVNAQFGFKEIDALEAEIKQPKYAGSLIIVAWEHLYLEKFVRQVVQHLNGDGSKIPAWTHKDFDSIYVLRITNGKEASFALDHEGLNPAD